MIKYRASSRNEYSLYAEKMRATEGSFHKYSWKPDSKQAKLGEILKDFTKEAQSYDITLQFRGELPERKALLDRLRNDFENDVVTKKPGRMYFGDYWIDGYCVESETGVSKIKNTWSQNDIIFYCPYPFWCREKKISFYASTQSIVDEGTKEENDNMIDNSVLDPDYKCDYPRKYQTRYRPAKKRYLRDYKYDYYHNHQLARLDNDHFAETDFKMFIYGPCTEPKIWIGDHLYHMAATLYGSEYIVIDSRKRTIVKYARNGVQENLFNKRDKENYIFKKIPNGKSAVKWNATFPFDVILFQERSEPPWSY